MNEGTLQRARATDHSEPHPRALVLTWGCVWTPVVLLLCIVSLGMHTRLGLGHWPEPMVDKYTTPAFSFHTQAVIGLGLFTMYAAGPLWLLCLCFRRFRVSARLHVMQAGVYAAGWGLVLAYVAWDPHRFVQWYLD